MYPKNNLAKIFIKESEDSKLSKRISDFTKIITLSNMNFAINCCDKWDSFLDVGAGDGRHSIPLLKKFKKGTAIEIDENKDLINLEKKFNNLKTIIGTINNLDEREKFDFILLSDVFEHIPLPTLLDFCNTLSEHQEKGGVIYIITPNPIFCGPATESELYFNKNRNEHHGHQKHFLKEEIINLFKDLGYEKIFCKYEETNLRQLTKRIIFSISMRDKKYQKYFLYKTMSPAIIYPIKLILLTLSYLTTRFETKNSLNPFNTRSQLITIKKCQ